MLTPTQWAELTPIERHRLQVAKLAKYHREIAGISDDPRERLQIADDIFHPGRIAPRTRTTP